MFLYDLEGNNRGAGDQKLVCLALVPRLAFIRVSLFLRARLIDQPR